MREIKFRAWDTKYSQWVTDRYGLFLSGQIIKYDRKADVDDGLVFRSENQMSKLIGVGFENIVLMQYTGLRDKNGKEIYERDIIQYIGTSAILPAQVVFEDGMFGVKDSGSIYPLSKLLSSMVFGGIYHVDLTVIGNIYENPELLKERE